MLLKSYLEKLNYKNKPEFINKYLKTPSLVRLQKVGYFCGMEHASKDVYDFQEYITRYAHSVTVALLTWKLTQDRTMTLAGLFHDIATPCFSHVIDYMNKDYETQESTEEYTEEILKNDAYLMKCLEEDSIKLEDISDFKKYSIVDNERPALCADRLDGIILTGISWTKTITKDKIDRIIDDLIICKNENDTDEISFKTESVANFVLNESKNMDNYCHFNYDNYMMELLAEITRTAINKEIITYEDLYYFNEEQLFKIFDSCGDCYINRLLNLFRNIKKSDIPDINLKNVKPRKLDPLVKGKRISTLNKEELYR